MTAEGVSKSPQIGFSFLFRDDKDTIGAMLDSFLPHVGEVVAVDTGSTDGSREIVEQKLAEFSGRSEITEFQWVDDFAVARAHGWERLTADWGLWGDSDDTLEGGESFPLLIQKAYEHQGQLPIGGFIFKYDYARTEGGQTVCELPRERLLRMDVGWNWMSPVHEVALAKSPCEFVSVESARWIHHKQPNEMQGDRNVNIIRRHIHEAKAAGVDPDPRMVAYLGVELAARGEHDNAIASYRRYMELSQWGEEKHQCIHRMADSYRAQGKFDNAIECETYAITHTAEHGVPEWPDHFFGIAEAMMGKGQWHEAITWFERGSVIGQPVSSMILNPRDYDYAPALGLSICYFEIGNYQKAAEFAHKALEIIPTELKAQAHAHRVMVKQREQRTVAAVKEHLESLIAYDENLKAREAIRHLPYVVRGDPAIWELVNHIRRSTYQIGSVKGYEHMYATNREVRNPDEFVEDASERFGRAALLRRGLESQAVSLGRPPRYLDAGCNDGWMGAHMEKIGVVQSADGIDLNPVAVGAARDRVERLGLNGTYLTGFVEESAEKFGEEKYDAISMFEVFEHLEDPHKSVGSLERSLTEGGVMYVSTPNGAFEKGLIDVSQWSANENKQHLRAVTNAEFMRFALQRGWLLDVELGERDGVQVVAYEPCARKGRIVIYLGPAWDRWSPVDLTTRGLGGSETAAVQLATGLAAEGWFVDVYGGMSTEGPYDGVMYQNWTMYDADEHCDVFISSRDASAVSKLVPNTEVKFLWCHDAHVGGNLNQYIGDYDGILTLTQPHADGLRDAEGVAGSEWDHLFLRTRNGVDLSRFPAEEVAKNREHTVIYSSSPDRGLDALLDMWPEIVKRVPRAKLKIFYGFDVFDNMHASNPAMKAWKAGLLKKAAALGKSVKLMGRVDQLTLAAEQTKARVWAYPYGYGNPTETSCITAMECMAAGLFCVATDTGALKETIGNGGVLVPGDPGEAAYRKKFIDAVALGMSNEPAFQHLSRRARLRSESFSWDDVVTQWDDLFIGRLDELRNAGRPTGLPAEVRH